MPGSWGGDGFRQHGHTDADDGGSLAGLTVRTALGATAPNLLLAGPTSGADAVPTLRALVAADIPASLITSGKLSTSTGSAVGTLGGGLGVSGNAYSFAPSVTCDLNPAAAPSPEGAVYVYAPTADPGDQTFRVGVRPVPGGIITCRWRYINASANPVLWVIADAAGNLLAVWESDDPPGNAGAPIYTDLAGALPAVQVAFPADALVPLTATVPFPNLGAASLGADDAPGDLSAPAGQLQPTTIADILALRQWQHPELADMPRRGQRLRLALSIRARAAQAGQAPAGYVRSNYKLTGAALVRK